MKDLSHVNPIILQALKSARTMLGTSMFIKCIIAELNKDYSGAQIILGRKRSK